MRLTDNFTLSEFKSRDGALTPKNLLGNILSLADNLQVLRDHFGFPIKVNSGYRSPEHNSRVGGGQRSQHLLGKAADIVIEGISPDDVADAIELLISQGKMQQGGLGRYDDFTHYDIRGTKARWDFRS
ncbi:MAG: D-Ala-D-Ala carboxypeptidase family metallohydrolase [Kangiellaceae bacterium]|jgi:uncharacterized protein YcbK (DUF882 family)|nr:D-Ala-D-Ala carboxypeptidase family metallohydrolase [Kangiellaceae bacterium]